MKIMYVSDALAIWGGLERVLAGKANLLASREGYEIFVVTANQGQHPLPYPLDKRVGFCDLDIRFHQQYQFHSIRRWRMRLQLQRLFKERLRQQIESVRPDVIVCMRIEFVKTLAEVKGDIPLVFESHSSCLMRRFEGYSFLRRCHAAWLNRQVRRTQTVVALTEGDAAEWRKITPRVTVIPNIVSLNEGGSVTDGKSKTVMFVGRFSKQKDLGSLLRIWELVSRRHPDWQLHIYGGYGEEQERLMPIVKGLGERVVVHEPTDRILTEYKKHAVLLLTSLFEPFGLVMPEAMSCGLPVVAFDCPYGPADIITDGLDGFLVKGRSVERFAEKVCQLIEQPALRRKMGQAAVGAAKRYRAVNVLPQWEALFDCVCPKAEDSGGCKEE